MRVTIINRKPVRVACIRNVGPYGEPILRFWQERVVPWMAANNLFGRPRYGISYDDPLVVAPEECRYDACVEVPADFSGSGEYRMATIPGGRYATTPFEGTAREIARAWDELRHERLPESNLQLESRPFFEYYDRNATFDPSTGVFSCELCIPISDV